MLLVQKQLIEALQNGLSSLFQIQANDLVLQETKKEFEGSYTFVGFPFTKQAGLAPAAIAASTRPLPQQQAKKQSTAACRYGRSQVH
jgi:hypothetical protein